MNDEEESPDIIFICDEEDDIKQNNVSNKKISFPIQELTNKMDSIFESVYSKTTSNNVSQSNSFVSPNQASKSTNTNNEFHSARTAYVSDLFDSQKNIIQNSNEIVKNFSDNRFDFSQSSLNLMKRSFSDYVLNCNSSIKQPSLSLKHSEISQVAQKNHFHLKRLNSNRIWKKSFSNILQETKRSRYISQRLGDLERQKQSYNKKADITEIEVIDLTKEFELNENFSIT